MRFLCCGDTHIGAGTGSLGPERLAEQEQNWRRCLEIGREHEVDAVLFAGDAWERRRPTPDEFLAFERPLIEFNEEYACWGVAAIPGNHDLTHADEGCGLDVLAEAGMLRLSRRPQVGYIPAPGQPSTVALATLPWASVSRLVAATNGSARDQIHQLAVEALLDTARGLRAQVDRPCVLLSHFAVEGFSTPSGIGTEMFREPLIPWHDLQEIGFDWLCFGHVHRPAARDNFVYVGSPLPLDFSEGDCEHGVWVLDTDSGFEFIPVESRGFHTIDIDADTALAISEEESGFPSNHFDRARTKIRYTATAEQARRIDQRKLIEAALDAGAYTVKPEPTIVKAQRARVAGLDENVDDERAFELYCDSIGIDDPERRAVLAERHRGFMEEVA